MPIDVTINDDGTFSLGGATVQITGLDVIAPADPDRPVSNVSRVGGGLFRHRLLGEAGEVLDRDDFDSLPGALAEAEAIVAIVESDKSHPIHYVALRGQLAKRDSVIAAQAAELAAKDQG